MKRRSTMTVTVFSFTSLITIPWSSRLGMVALYSFFYFAAVDSVRARSPRTVWMRAMSRRT